MNCRTLQLRWTAFLHDQVSADERQAIEQHLENCQACQGLVVMPVELTELLRQRLPRAVMSPDARRRVLDALERDSVAPAAGPIGTTPAARGGLSWLRSAWLPRLAMAAVLVVLFGVPLRHWLRAPVLAEEAVQRHEHHLTTDWSRLTCCKSLDLHPGDPLGDPAQGAVVPDLSADGLHLVGAGHCDDGGVEVTGLIYKTADESQTFSLYITDRELDNFHAMRTRDSGGIREARHEVRQSEVTIWEQSGLIWFWIGPRSNPEYSMALSDLRHF